MNKLKTILVDDEPRGLSTLLQLLQYNCPEVEVVAMCGNAEDAKKAIGAENPQLVFLDIAMPEKSGFDLLEELGERRFEVIFVTAHNDFMMRAFQFSCVDYLLKPVVDKQLAAAVARATARLLEKSATGNIETLLYNLKAKDRGQKPKICITSLQGFQVVKLPDIMYCEASGNYTIFHLENQQPVCAARTMHEYETVLEDSGFVRIHKSFLVNLEHVKQYHRGEGGTIIMTNNAELDVSRRRKDMFIDKMKEFYKF